MEKYDVKSHGKNLKAIIKAKDVSEIAYLDNPLSEGGEIRYLTLTEFKEKFDCDYTESIVVNNLTLEPAKKEDFKNARAFAAYERLNHPLNGLVVCKMSDKVGYGLFTTEDIKRGTVICVYAGEHDPHTAEHVYSYGSINAKNIGGMARFMQHQPISKEAHEAYLINSLEDYRLFAINENITEEEAKVLLNNENYISEKKKAYENKVKSNDAWDSYDFKHIFFKCTKQCPYRNH